MTLLKFYLLHLPYWGTNSYEYRLKVPPLGFYYTLLLYFTILLII